MYSYTSRVRYSEVDEQGRLSIPSLVNYLQDCSTFQSEALGVGPAHIAKTGLAWLLSTWQIEIDELPKFGDEIVVSTWATGFKGLLASRNFTISLAGAEPGAEPIMRADSRWFMFDMQAGKPARIPAEESAPYEADAANDEPLAMEPAPKLMRVAGEGEPGVPLMVTNAHIDTNHHVNNAQYVSMALGTLPEGAACAPTKLDVRYSIAAKLGDVIYPHIHHTDDATIVTLDNAEASGKPYATVSLRR